MVEGAFDVVVDDSGFQTVESKSKRRRRRKQNPASNDTAIAPAGAESDEKLKKSVSEPVGFGDQNEDPLAVEKTIHSNGVASSETLSTRGNGVEDSKAHDLADRVEEESEKLQVPP